MEGGWGFNVFEFDGFEPNIDDSEDLISGAPKTATVWTTPIGEGIRPGYQCSHIQKDTKENAIDI